MQKNINLDLWLSRAGLGLIFCYCLAASIFCAYFAQIHLTLSFLPFPVFVGEVLLSVCLLILMWVSRDGKSFSQRSVLLLCLYFGWVLLKALINYCYDGPLTVRNAALFYYPIFAVFAYCFYHKAKVSLVALLSLAFLAAGMMLFKVMAVWYWWTYVILFVIAVLNIKSGEWRWLGWIFLAVVILLGKEYLYKGPRSHFVSIFVAVVFLTSYLGALFIKRRDHLHFWILLIGFLSFVLGFLIFSNRSAVHSVTSLQVMEKTYNDYERKLQAQQEGFVPQSLPVHLYNPKKFKSLFVSPETCAVPPSTAALSAASVSTVPAPVSSPSVASKPAVSQPVKFEQCILKKIVHSRIREWRRFDDDEANIIFRIFVWRDMAHELIEKKAWWGFSFGHPQRSRSLEVLHWAESEWSRDGWITPHNSFFHIIYRAGILGLCLIGILFFMVGKLVRDFFMMNSIEGGFLVGGLLYWLVLSNFFVILEFPYNAIVFWTLFGITWAYRDALKAKAIK